MKHENRTEIVKLRLTPAEKEQIRKQAEKEHITVSDYIRRVAASPPEITRKEYNEAIEKTIYEIHKIGTNINQIAKKYNEYQYIEPSRELVRYLERMFDFTEMIQKCICE